MPQELKKVNGRWQLVGDDHSQDHTPPPPTPGAKPKAKPKAKAAQKPWWHAITNELRYAGKQLRSLEATQKPGTVRSQNPALSALTVLGLGPTGVLVNEAARRSPVVRQLQAAIGFGALQTAGEGVIAMGQKILAPGKYADARRSPPGRALNAYVRANYQALGAKQPEDLTEGQRGVVDSTGRMIGVEVATSLVGGPIGKGLTVGVKGASWASRGVRWGTALGVTHGLSSFLQDSTQGNPSNMLEAATGIKGIPFAVDPTKDDRVTSGFKSIIPNFVGGELIGLAGSAGAQAVGKGFGNIRRWRRAAGANTTHVTAGEKLQARGLVEDIEGQQRFTEQALEKPAPVPIPQTPDQARDAVLARWGRGGQQPADQVPGSTEMVAAPVPREDGPAYQEWLRQNASTAIVPVKPGESAPVAPLPRQPLAPRDELRGEGLADPWGMGPDPSSPVQQSLGAKTGARQEPPAPAVKESLTAPAVAEQSSATPAAAAEEVAPLDPWSYDPELPEVADVQKLVSQLDPAELQAIATVGADGGPVLQHIEEVIASRPAPQPREEISEAWAGVPTNSLSEIYLNGIGDLQPWAQLLDKINPTTLKELSHPEVSPRLSQLISDATGKAWEAFDREDMINGIKALSADGTTILPNRLSGDVRLMRVEDLAAAPQEFQYKEGVDAKGVQIASHLRDVKKWDPNAEGVLEVFPDPRDGITKVVEGHGRRALAMRLGVPTVPVKEVNATTVPGARSAGAISNISQGNGTPFDAAKFIKGTGMTDKAQLQAAGIALDRGFGRQGLALSKLPQDIFQEAVNDEPLFSWYVALGESGLDEPGMRGAYQVLKQRPKMTLGTFREVLDVADSMPTVKAADDDQTVLFGEAFLKPMLQRAELSADVRSGLAKDRRLFGFMTRNADTLSEAGNTTIDTAAAGQRVADAQQALGLFDTLKNQAGPVGELLSKGAERIAQGENASIVAKQIQREIGDSIERELTSSGMKAKSADAELAPDAELDPEVQSILDELEAIANSLGESATKNAQSAQRSLLESADIIDGNLPATDKIAPSPRRRGTPLTDALAADLNELGGLLAQQARGTGEYLQRQAQRLNQREAMLRQQAADIAGEMSAGPDRAALEAHAIQRAIANGEVRPTEMKPLELPPAPSADLKAVERELAAMDPTLPLEDQLPNMPATRQAAADELRLAAEYARQDAEITWAAEKAAREAEGYDLLSLQEKKAQGLGADWFTPETDSRGQGRNFHGAADRIALESGGEFGGDGMNIYGDGFYTTDDVATAAKYRKKNRGSAGSDAQPTVYEATEKQPVRFFDLEKDDSPAVNALLNDIVAQGRYGADLVEQAIEDASTGTLGEIMDEMRAWSGSMEIPAYEVQGIFQEIIDTLQSEGYGGFTHTGGAKAGGGKRLHKVSIYWDPADAIGLKEMRPVVTPEVMPPELIEPPAPEPPRRRIADTLRATLRTLAESDARLYRAIGETVGEASGAPGFTLPPDLAKASPRYGRNTLQFESDLDRAAYVLANDKAKGGSKSANKFRDALIAAGFDPDQVAAHGTTVKEAVKAATRDTAGETVVVPVQDFAAGRPRLPLPEQQRQIEGTKAQIDDLQQKLNEGGCGT